MLLFLYFSSFVDNVNGINDHIARVHFFWFALPHWDIWHTVSFSIKLKEVKSCDLSYPFSKCLVLWEALYHTPHICQYPVNLVRVSKVLGPFAGAFCETNSYLQIWYHFVSYNCCSVIDWFFCGRKYLLLCCVSSLVVSRSLNIYEWIIFFL